ncbi:MAG TPA: biotin/lipoyl-binding protein [Candidatus Acidoferrales bacterium]|jgi:biotin carboxyl carrier protein|nr:biotin/lipoyl-binding protein [Candidatus Acidoferrales bacterium]
MNPDAQPQKSFGGRWALGILVLALLFVLMPFLFWNATWFGRPITDNQIAKALTDRSHPREIQHVLSQFETRIEKGDPSVRRWYPQMVALSKDPVDEIRVTDAWVMGQDNTSQDFHAALLPMLNDPNPMVQRNAALSLVRFQDDSGHALIVSMLRPYVMGSPLAGVLATRLKPADIVNPGTLVAHIESGGKSNEVRSQVPGTVERWLVSDGSTVTAGQPILSLAPNESMAWEALRALYLAGRPEDLPDVEGFVRGNDGMSPQVAVQALDTARAIRDRAKH